MRTSSATTRASSTTRRRDAEYLPEVTIHAKCLFPRSVCHCSSLMARQTEASEERSGGGSNEKEKPLVSRSPTPTSSRSKTIIILRSRNASCLFLAKHEHDESVQAVGKKRKRATKTKTENRFKPHKAVVLAKREIPSEAPRHLHARVPGCTARVRTEGHASGSLCPCERGSCEGAARGRARSSPRPRNSRNPTGGGFPNANRGIPRGFATP